MCSKELFLFVCLVGLLGGLRLTSTTTTTTFVAAMSIGNQDIERYFRSVNASQSLAVMTEDRIAMDTYTFAFINYTYYGDDHIKHEVQYAEEKARYGEGRILSVKGKLVHVTDANDFTDDYACSPNILGTLGNPTPSSGVSWIALVRRGRCTFEEKVKNVHYKGAAGVIVYNDKTVPNLEKMQIKGKTRNITAVITYLELGASMADIVDRGFDMEAAIIEGKSGMRPINTLNSDEINYLTNLV
ncbi:protein goliath-like [Teleopsis dalmanni]|uniref:protein goliath-like n=1 Tax=Teleopsis dalmanni TaxID=139649 RepID=UPI0018CCE0D2|nr:protein goliath-like [Teleopsis dalmanni]